MSVVTIQKTAKWIKATQAIALLLFFISIWQFGNNNARAAGSLFFIAIALRIFASMARWWNHG